MDSSNLPALICSFVDALQVPVRGLGVGSVCSSLPVGHHGDLATGGAGPRGASRFSGTTSQQEPSGVQALGVHGLRRTRPAQRLPCKSTRLAILRITHTRHDD